MKSGEVDKLNLAFARTPEFLESSRERQGGKKL